MPTELIQSPYSNQINSSRLLLFQGSLSLYPINEKTWISGDGSIWLCIPNLSLEFEMTISQETKIIHRLLWCKLQFQDDNGLKSLKACVKTIDLDSWPFHLKGWTEQELSVRPILKLSSSRKILLHIFNFNRSLLDRAIYRESKSLAFARMTLENDQATWILHKDPESKKLKDDSFHLTCCAELKFKHDIKPSWELIERESEKLHFFLSFIEGRWIPATLPILIEENDKVIMHPWEMWFNRGRYSYAFCTEIESPVLPHLFRHYCHLLENQDWNIAMPRIISWYVSANNGLKLSIEGSILWVQSALELMSWTYLVHYKKILTATQFKKPGKGASHNIRELLKRLDVDIDLSPSLHHLASQDISDGPCLLVKARNDITHPERRTEVLSGSSMDRLKVLFLGLSYLEEALIKLIGIKDYKARRLERLSENDFLSS